MEQLAQAEFVQEIQTRMENEGYPLNSKKQAEVVRKVVFEIMEDSFLKGQSITVRNFGSFKPVVQKARTGVNPQTGEKIEIPEKKNVRFKANNGLKERLNS